MVEGVTGGRPYKLNQAEFEIVVNNAKVFKRAKVKITTRAASLSVTVAPGNVYKARVRITGPGVNWSPWSDYSSDTDTVEKEEAEDTGSIPVPSAPSVSVDKYTLKASAANIVTTGKIGSKKFNLNTAQFEIVLNDKKVVKRQSVKITTRYAAITCKVTPGNVYKARLRVTGPKIGWSDWSDYSSDTEKVAKYISPAEKKKQEEAEKKKKAEEEKKKKAEEERKKAASFPAPVKSLKVVATGSNSVRLTWPTSKNATSYEVNYVDKLEDFDRTSGTSVTSTIGSVNIYGLDLGKVYYFRVCAIKDNSKTTWFPAKAWDAKTAVSILLGMRPTAPTTFSTSNTIKAGDIVDLYWIHNTQDNSAQRTAELELTFITPDTKQVTEVITINNKYYGDADRENENLFYRIDTSKIHVGTSTSKESIRLDLRVGGVIQWRVRTKGILNSFSPWSVSREVEVFAPPWLSMTVSDILSDWFWDTFNFETDTIYNTVRTPVPRDDNNFTTLPISMQIECGPTSQIPVGYNIVITSDSTYTYTDITGEAVTVMAGDTVYSVYFNSTEYSITRVLTPSDVTFQDTKSYTIHVTVTMNSGLTASDEYSFNIDWKTIPLYPNASVAIDEDELYASIVPYCTTEYAIMYDEDLSDDEALLSPDTLLSVYRISNDGELVEVARNLENSRHYSIVDPHPTLDWVSYRIVASSVSSGQIAYVDTEPIDVPRAGIVISWDEDWDTLVEQIDYSDSASSPYLEDVEHTGKTLKLPYNVDITENNSPDVELVDYIGRKRSVSYYGTHLGETASWSTQIARTDKDYDKTIELLRRLSKRTGDVYVRESMNRSGYWANVKVSYDIHHHDIIVPITLDITRVEGGM